jgi:L-aspartate oxidase
MAIAHGDVQRVDFLVIGSGIAGLTFALKAHPGSSVAVVTKKDLPESSTAYAQGGIAASVGETDSWELHEQDTLTAGAGLCDPEVVRLVTREAPRLVDWLVDLGARFDQSKTPGGLPQLRLGREGGHSRRRIIHTADHTGQEIERTLVEAARRHGGLAVREYCTAVDLIVSDGECLGAWVLDTRAQRAWPVLARATVLATGGCGQVYRYTTNPPIATGDGMAVARRAGAMLANMEFVQFHPTTLCHPGARAFLISERARGEGGTLWNALGERFMLEVHPLAELAPRDVVARAIDMEMKATGAECVYLDLRQIGAKRIVDLFPGIYERCLSVDIDITRRHIPVSPAAHYMCGGVWTDLWGRTSLSRLYACGEVAYTGLHGANRLASNSLLKADTRSVPELSLPSTREEPGAVRAALQREMWQNVGIVRSDASLAAALAAVRELMADGVGHGPIDASIESANLLVTAEAIIECALLRRESRGGHFNQDCPERDDLRWQRPTLLSRTETPRPPAG